MYDIVLNISFHFIPLVMCVFYFQSKLALKVITHITNGTVIINNMHCMYIAEMYTVQIYKNCIHFYCIHTVHGYCTISYVCAYFQGKFALKA